MRPRPGARPTRCWWTTWPPPAPRSRRAPRRSSLRAREACGPSHTRGHRGVEMTAAQGRTSSSGPGYYHRPKATRHRTKERHAHRDQGAQRHRQRRPEGAGGQEVREGCPAGLRIWPSSRLSSTSAAIPRSRTHRWPRSRCTSRGSPCAHARSPRTWPTRSTRPPRTSRVRSSAIATSGASAEKLTRASPARSPIAQSRPPTHAAIFEKALRIGEGKKFKTFEKRVERINDYEAELELESDDELRDALRGAACAGPRRRVARRPDAGELRDHPRGVQAHARAAPLRRSADRRHGAARRLDRGDEDRRGQDAAPPPCRWCSTPSPRATPTATPPVARACTWSR